MLNDRLTDLNIIMVTAGGVIVLECESFSAGMLSDVVSDALVLSDLIIRFMSDIRGEGLTDVNANIFSAARTDLEFTVSTPLGKLGW